MVLVEILLPVTGDETMTRDMVESVTRALTTKFGGATSFVRAPGEGAWQSGERVVRDRIVVVEVMTDTLDESWWRTFRSDLELRLEQREIVIRSHAIQKL